MPNRCRFSDNSFRLLRRNLVGGILLLILAMPVRGQEVAARTCVDLRKLMGDVAGEVEKKLPLGMKMVAVGRFEADDKIAVNAGPGLSQLLSVLLEDRGVKVVDEKQAALLIEGKIIVWEKGDRKKVGLRVRVGKEEKSYVILSREDVDKLMPPSSVFSQQTILLERPDGQYGVQICVKFGDEYQPLPIAKNDGFPRVPLKQGQEYSIRLFNHSSHEAAVWVGIDGLSIFAFKQDQQSNGKRQDYRVLVPSGKEPLELRGWYFKPGHLRSFKISDYPQSAAPLLKSSAPSKDMIGMIQAQFRASWKEGTKPPSDENPLEISGDNATGFGPWVKGTWLIEPRNYGKHRGTITVRY